MRTKRVVVIFTHIGIKCLIAILLTVVITITINTVIHTGAEYQPLAGRRILIDPGHGGIDSGATDGGSILEKDINLQIALKLKQSLESFNAKVGMTRETDTALDHLNRLSASRHSRDLLARVNFINSGEYDLFISIHANISDSRNTIGPLVLYSPKISHTKYLAQFVQRYADRQASQSTGKNISHTAEESDLFILRNAKIPGLLVETGFLSNAVEKRLLQDEEYQEKLANSIVEGILEYCRAEDEWNKALPSFVPDQDVEPFQFIHEVEFVLR